MCPRAYINPSDRSSLPVLRTLCSLEQRSQRGEERSGLRVSRDSFLHLRRRVAPELRRRERGCRERRLVRAVQCRDLHRERDVGIVALAVLAESARNGLLTAPNRPQQPVITVEMRVLARPAIGLEKALGGRL